MRAESESADWLEYKRSCVEEILSMSDEDKGEIEEKVNAIAKEGIARLEGFRRADRYRTLYEAEKESYLDAWVLADLMYLAMVRIKEYILQQEGWPPMRFLLMEKGRKLWIAFEEQ
jgi:hypothetical protein